MKPLFAVLFLLCGSSTAFAQLAVKDSCVIYNSSGLRSLNQSSSSIADKLTSANPTKDINVKSLGGTAFEMKLKSPYAGLSASNVEPELIDADEAKAACETYESELPAGFSIGPNHYYQVNYNPNDPRVSDQWALAAMSAFSAWDVSTGASEVIVAVLDTGVDYNHPDLAANMYKNPGEIPGNGIDDDGNGYADDVYGYDFMNNDSDPYDDHGHGTHCAGNITGGLNNALGVAGVAGGGAVKVIALKFLGATGGGSLAGAVSAFNYLIDLKNRTGAPIRIASNSWGGGGFSSALEQAIQAATQAGIISVAAAGNSSNDNDTSATYPANFTDVVSVASTNEDGSLSSFSNYGDQTVQIAAPGGQILSTYPNNSYRSLSGTSMATPYVAAGLALLMSAEPTLSNSQALYRLYATSVPRSDGSVTYGDLNLNRLLRNIGSQDPNIPTEKSCNYTVTSDSYQAHSGAQSAAVVMSADEYNFTEVSVPNDFEFFGSKLVNMYLSANVNAHVLKPTTMDYKADDSRLNVISPLNTDLVSDVSVYSDDDKMVVYWNGRVYGDTAEVEVFLTLNKDHSIRFDVKHDASLVGKLQENVRVAIAGNSADEKITYAFNESYPDTSEFALIFTPECTEVEKPTPPTPPSEGEDSVGITAVKLVGKKKPTLLITTAAKLNSVPVLFAIDGQQCPDPLMINLTKLGNNKVKLPKSKQKAVLTASAGGLSDSIAVKRSGKRSKGRKSRKRRRSLSFSQVQKICNKITTKAKAVRK